MNASLSLLKQNENERLVNEFLTYLRSDKGCRASTIQMYFEDLSHFISCYPARDLLKLKEKDIREYKYSLVNRNLAPRTINRKLAVLRSFYNYFVNMESPAIPNSPVRNIFSIKVPKTEPVVMHENQAETLLDGILLTGLYAIRDYAIFSTFLFTGVRVSELIHLEIRDVDFENHELFIRDGKGGKDRIIPMVPRLENALKMYLHNDVVYVPYQVKGKRKTKTLNRLAKNKSGRAYFENHGKCENNWLFITKSGNCFTEKGIDYLFKQYTKRFGIYQKGLSLHALRRSCLTFLYKQGVDLFLLKEISGHVRIQTLENYLHIDRTNVQIAINKHPLANKGMDIQLVDLVRDN